MQENIGTPTGFCQCKPCPMPPQNPFGLDSAEIQVCVCFQIVKKLALSAAKHKFNTMHSTITCITLYRYRVTKIADIRNSGPLEVLELRLLLMQSNRWHQTAQP